MAQTTVTAVRPRVPARARGRADGAVKASGRARYTADLELPGMLHARLLLAGRPHARLRSLDVGAARAAAGVRAVLTQVDVPDVRYGMCVRDRTLFVDEVARYEGEIVAAVAADTRAQADAAVGLISAEWDDLPPLLDSEAALAADAVPLHPAWRSYAIDREETRSANDCAHVTLVKGDVDAGFASAFAVVEQSFATDMTHPLAIEPHAVLADWRDGAVTIWTTTQVPFLARAGVALTLGLPESAVRVVVTHLGGGFGGKCDFHLEAHAAALSRAAGRPVRLVLSRAEEFVVPDLTRHPISMTFSTALREDGTIAARRARLVLDSGAYASHGPTASEIATLMAVGPYRIDDLAIEAHTVYTSRTPAGSTRAPTGPQLCWALEQHTDALAARADLDPIAFRLRNLVGDGDTGPTGQRLVRPTARDCLLRAEEVMRAGGGAAPEPGWLEGVGFAVGTWGNVPLPSGASVRMHADGSATLVSGAQDNGSGAAVALPALVADVLGITVERVALVHQDTGATPFDYGSLGSQTTFNAGRAALAAADEVAARLRADAAERLGCAASEVVLQGGRATAGEERIPIADLAAAAQAAGRPLAAEVSPQPPERPAEPGAARSQGRAMYSSFPFPAYYCCAARVAVDPATGRVVVRRVVACHDVGEVLNRPGAEGQIEGGVAHSLGLALSEGAVLDGGRQLTTRLMDYRLQTAADVPPIDVELIAPRTPGDGPRGARGIGEAGVIAAAGAVANAIADATGVQLRQLPMLPHRVWAALRDAEAAS
ncbi:molybdopterin cofactor-binding domain-containing protein [Conexibacter stalactiti]|uniref:Molybdopterin cofactor-binding domain-containing protein n=1 Tax=Conexibacter stalactiti TaxID=1940611 RepID=A0ABU4HSK1_9ACTN|nr:molybdopterin cofactor-binding domain-containing protein [Conexibacter stalactiti]MDW5596297.1 molybdopterin cofactor-binding domain-containing protein [Conexibacter stalactiti]MEC5036939.1 molybdopterin cofactor-binding domain-containing protein [Conexibacter stalactiti]